MYGYIAVVMAAVLWGVGGVAAKFLFNQTISPFLLVKIRMTMSCLILIACLLVYDRKLLYVPKEELKYFAVLGTIGMASMQLTYFITISLTNVATAVFLQYLSTVVMAAYAVIGEKATFSNGSIAAIALAMFGGFLTLLGASGVHNASSLGIATGVLSALVMAFYTIYSRYGLQRYQPVTVLTYSLGFGALLFWLLMPYTWEPGSITKQHWLMFLYVAVFSTVIPFFLYFIGLKQIPPTNVGVTACLEPVIAAITAYVVLGETMGWLQILGGTFVIAAVVLLQTQRSPDSASAHSSMPE
jgi:drug/metabolite transporter (DMT)-like permease